jgi:hypothetical protein
MDNHYLPLVVVVNKDQPDTVSSEFFVSPLPHPKGKSSSNSHGRDIVPIAPKRISSDSADDTASVETASVASDIDSSCDGSISSRNSIDSDNEDDEGKDASMEFEMEVEKLKLLRQRNDQNHLKHQNIQCHPSLSHQHDPRRHPQRRQSQLHPQQEKKLRGLAVQEQTHMIQEIHGMLSLLIDDNHGSSETGRSSSGSNSKKSGSNGSSSKKKSRSRNNGTQSSRNEMLELALIAKDKLSRFENEVESIRRPENYDPRKTVEKQDSVNSFKLPAPPLWLDSPSQSKRLVSPDNISVRLMSDRDIAMEPQAPKRTGSIHNNFSASFNFEKTPDVQKSVRPSSHSRKMPAAPSMHERFSASFDFERSPQVQKALLMSSHRRKMSAASNMHERFSKSFNFERTPEVKRTSRRYSSSDMRGLPFSPTLDEVNSEHFELELEPDSEPEPMHLEPPAPPAQQSEEPKKTSRLSSIAYSLQDRITKSPAAIKKVLKLSTLKRTPRCTRKGTKKSPRPVSPQESSTKKRAPKRTKKREKAGKALKSVTTEYSSIKNQMSEPEELEETAELSKSIIYEVKMTKNQSPGPMEEEAKPSRSVTPEGSHHGRITVASPGIQKSMIGEKLHPQVHKSQPDLAGRITGVLSEYNNADQLMQMLEGPEQNMTERIVEVLEALKGHGSSRAKSRAVKA